MHDFQFDLSTGTFTRFFCGHNVHAQLGYCGHVLAHARVKMGGSSKSLLSLKSFTTEQLLNTFMNDSDSETDRFDLGDNSETSENEAMNNSEWQFKSDEEQPTSAILRGSGKLP